MNNNVAGFLSINKPPGMSSHNVVAFVRRLLPKGLKVGHLGTLDPGACGVLPLAVGWATRTIQYFPPNRKAYCAEITFGSETDTLDAHGSVIGQAPVPELTTEQLESVCRSFEGEIMQVPPQISALHVDGQRAYKLSRSGCSFELPPRPVSIYGIKLVCVDKHKILIDVECSAGTYIRSLARDFGHAIGCGAHLSFLLRTRSGIFHLKHSSTIEDLRNLGVENCLWPVDRVLIAAVGQSCLITGHKFQGGQDISSVYLSSGKLLNLNEIESGSVFVVYNYDNGEFIGVGVVAENSSGNRVLRLERLYSKGV
ncbi:MAG: tRNA pseudouridine(55) synthase TruB [Candidatus Bruticola sp.]